MQSTPSNRTHGRRSAAPRAAASRTVVPLPLSMSPAMHRLAICLTALSLISGLMIAPAERASAASASGRIGPPQALTVSDSVSLQKIERDAASATDGVQTLRSNGTNAAWAKLVLVFGGWPGTDENVSALLRWMRQENGPHDWWNRNNPLNNGYGSGGGGGLGSYPDLVAAARYAAENLHRGYPAIAAALSAGSSADAVARAIWASPWSTSHYANGSHWSTAPVAIVRAPASAW